MAESKAAERLTAHFWYADREQVLFFVMHYAFQSQKDHFNLPFDSIIWIEDGAVLSLSAGPKEIAIHPPVPILSILRFRIATLQQSTPLHQSAFGATRFFVNQAAE